MKYLKYFEDASAYEAYKNGSDFILPNVSYVVDNNQVKFNPIKWGKVILSSDGDIHNSGFQFAYSGGLFLKKLKVGEHNIALGEPTYTNFTINSLDDTITQGYYNNESVSIAMVRFIPKIQLPSNISIQWYTDGSFFRNERNTFYIDNNSVYIAEINQEVRDYRAGEGYLVTPVLLNTDTSEVIPCDVEIISEKEPFELRLWEIEEYGTDYGDRDKIFTFEYLIDEKLFNYALITNTAHIVIFGGGVIEFYPIFNETCWPTW